MSEPVLDLFLETVLQELLRREKERERARLVDEAIRAKFQELFVREPKLLKRRSVTVAQVSRALAPFFGCRPKNVEWVGRMRRVLCDLPDTYIEKQAGEPRLIKWVRRAGQPTT